MKNVRPKNKEELSPESGSRKRVNSRNKGGNYERWLAKFFRERFNYSFCKTSRQTSRILDDCGVDLSGLPYNIQAKSGYWSHRPKADEIFKNMKEKLEANFPPTDVVHGQPKLLFHKLDGHQEEHHLVTMTFIDFIKLLKGYEQSKREPDKAVLDDKRPADR